MGARTLAALVASMLAILVGFRSASADVKADVTTKIRAAMKAYDAFEYDSAKKLLGQAIALAKRGKLDADPILATAHLDLGIVMYALDDVDAAKASFRSAIQVDPNVELDLAYKSPDLAKLLDSVRARVTDEPVISGGNNKLPSTAECSSVKGVEHRTIHAANAGESLPIEARVGASIAKVSVMYRVDGANDFVEFPLKRDRDCRYAGVFPASAMQGKVLYYYVAAFGNGPLPVATKGSAELPNIVALNVPTEGIGNAASTATAASARTASSKPTVLFALAGGSGLSYVRGTTEAQNTVKRCCFGTSLVVATAEVSYFLTPQLAVGGVFRMGVPIGANFEGHSNRALAGLSRLRYALSPSGEGLHLLAEVGFGLLRHAVKVDNPQAGMDTDVLAQGPLLIGGGMGATIRLTRSLALFADVTVLGGIAVIDRLGTSVLNSGVAGDVTVGVGATL